MSDDLSILRARFADHSGSETSQTTGSTVTSAPASIADLSAPIDDDPRSHFHAVSARLSHERAHVSGTSHEEELDSTQSIWNLLAPTLSGPSLVVLPYIVGAGGVGFTPLLMVLYCILSYHSLLIMGELVRRTGTGSFSDMAYLGMGNFGFVWATISSILLRWGGHLLGSFIIIGNVGAGLLASNKDAAPGSAFAESTSIRTTIIWFTAGLTGAVALWPILFAPNAPLSVMRRYWVMALLCAAMMALVCFAMLAQYIRFYNDDAFEPSKPLPFSGNNSQSVFDVSMSASVFDDAAALDLSAFVHGSFTQTLGGIAFSFSYTDSAVFVIRSMRDATPHRWLQLTVSALSTTLALALLMGLSGFFSFGFDARDNVIENFCHFSARSTCVNASHLVNFIRYGLCIHILFYIPVASTQPQRVLLSLVRLAKPDWVDNAAQRPWAVHTTHAVATATVISVAASLACTFDDISLFSLFHGGFASLSTGLLIPAICYLRLVVDGNYRNSSYALLLLGFASIFCAIVALLPRLSLPKSDMM